MAVSTIPNPNPQDIVVPTSSDLNNITQTGTYSIFGINNVFPANIPQDANSALWVINRSDMPVQLIINNSFKMYFRVKYSTGWKPWQKVTSSEIS